MNVGIVGCGDISRRYAASIAAAPGLELLGVADLLPERATTLAGELRVTAYRDLRALLDDPAVEVVVNLTAPQAHAEITAASLDAGKHVHSEKPLALRHAEAQELVELAARRGVRLSCAPATLLGEAQQTAWRLVREQAIGVTRVAYAEANWGRIESWHPAPESLYEVGPLVDVGVYPLTIVTALFGPVQRVQAFGALLEPDRVTLTGRHFRPSSPDLLVVVLELADGVVVRLTASFYVGPSKQRGLELHGDHGALYLATWMEFDSRLELRRDGAEYAPVPLLREPYAGIDWSRPLVDLADATAAGRPHRTTGEHAAHIVEVFCAAAESLATAGPVPVRSTFAQPAPMEWAR